MVLDAHAHLTRQGWKGKGHAVKDGHLSRPLAVKVKNNLNGLGKDRDDAFPFWDHVFSSVASSIIIPTSTSNTFSQASSSRSVSPEPSSSTTPPGSGVFHRTTTGIISPYASQQSSGVSTPTEPMTTGFFGSGSALNMTAMSAAKREAARRGLYAQFMKGKVILPVAPVEQEVVASRKGKERGVLLNEVKETSATSSTKRKDREQPTSALSTSPTGFLISAPSLAPPTKKCRSSTSNLKSKKFKTKGETEESKDERRERKRVEKMAKEARKVLKKAKKEAKESRKKSTS